jgi:dTDP-4-dehydrorhamnose reductase
MITKKNRVWVTGADGLIGSHIVTAALGCAPCFDVAGLTRAQVDLVDFDRVRALYSIQQPSLIIHCAALSQSTACQSNPALARKLNVEVTAFLAELAAEIGFIFFSTDLVFDGRKGYYTEDDATNPLSVYAETKVEAEQIVLRNPGHTVVRTSLTGGVSKTRSRGFNEEICNAWKAGTTVRLFSDEFRCPIAAPVTARAIWELATLEPRGIYHLAGGERLSRLEIGQLLAERHPELNARIEPCSLREYQGAPRSPDCSMNMTKIELLLSFKLPGLAQWLHGNPNADF